MDIGVTEIRVWHVTDNGWSDIGYHDVITRSGKIEEGRSVETAGAHVKGYNSDSIGICLVGGKGGKETDYPEEHFTTNQLKSLKRLLRSYKALYPKATVHGHNEFAAKACPCFNVQKWMGEEVI